MFFDLNVMESKTFQTNVCIIGSGIGGGTLAYKLHESCKDFILVEGGDLDKNSGTINYENVGLPFGLNNTTSIEVGGTSNLWHGVLSMLDSVDFEKRDWIPHSGWPISAEDLKDGYKKASEFLGILAFDDFYEEKLADSLLGKLKEMPFNRELLKNKIFQQPLPPKRIKHTLKEILQNARNQHCIYNGAALELLGEKDSNACQKLLIKTKNNQTFYVEAKVFVICCGALETPRLLLNSRSQNPKGLGNEHDLVGRFLMDHPMGNLCQVEFKKPQKAHIYSDYKYRKTVKIKSGLVLKDSVQKQYGLPNHNFYMRPSFAKGIKNENEKIKLSLLTLRDTKLSLKDVYNIGTHLNVALQIMSYRFALNPNYKYSDLFFITEQIPNEQSRVTLSSEEDAFGYKKAKVDWRVLKQDIDSVYSYFDIIKKEILSEESYSFTHDYYDLQWENVFTSAAHHVGTARMASSAKEGVLDKNLKLFEKDNVYVCDGSAFATSGNVNSGLTISALACRLSEHLNLN